MKKCEWVTHFSYMGKVDSKTLKPTPIETYSASLSEETGRGCVYREEGRAHRLTKLGLNDCFFL